VLGSRLLDLHQNKIFLAAALDVLFWLLRPIANVILAQITLVLARFRQCCYLDRWFFAIKPKTKREFHSFTKIIAYYRAKSLK